jgi:precorrin-6B C5,15-methyltransferase / cobalt-precorrin-6B C5,C15-methyltransferase
MHVIGVGADGWAGLTAAAVAVLTRAEVVYGSKRQLDLLPATVTAERVAWPSPLVPALRDLVDAHAGRRRVVLASGDPTFFGIATTLGRELPGVELEVIPHPSSVSLACARLGWAQQDVDVVSLVGRPVSALHPVIQPGRRVLVLLGRPEQAGAVADLLSARGYGNTPVTALSNLGASDEQQLTAIAHVDLPPLTVLALACEAAPGAPRRPRTPGLPDDAYEHDGQLTKRHVRALTVAALAPTPGELLWDVGGGSGSIGIEWMRTHPACRAVSVERDSDRAARIRANAEALGVPDLRVVVGAAPAALEGLETPDAIFVGGGLTTPGLLETCWAALGAGGRLVANVTTVESEARLAEARARYGGDLVRVQITNATPVGRFTGWRPAMPVTQWSAVKGAT